MEHVAGLLARVIREASLRVQGNVETAVEYLLRLRHLGFSQMDHWLRPETAQSGFLHHRR
jgi:hypothetical protein